jgi:hypothetical protein
VIFDSIRKFFLTPAEIEKPLAPERDELAAILDEIKAARERHAAIQASIASLTATIEGGVAATRELNALVANPSGVKGLAEFVAGGDKGAVSLGVDRTARAVQAADVARGALPTVEGELAKANAEIAHLEEKKTKQIAAVMISHGDILAQKYIEKFREFAELHDQIVGFARGCNNIGCGSSVIIASEPLEAPRFNLPSLACSDVYTTFLRHVPNQQTVAAASMAWSRFGTRLAQDPRADVGADLLAELATEVGKHPEHRTSGLIRHQRRERAEPDVNQVLFGGDRPRRVIQLPR